MNRRGFLVSGLAAAAGEAGLSLRAFIEEMDA
jgi:hypothetical protein